MKKSFLITKFLIGVFSFLMMSIAHAEPMWTFTPLTATSISITDQGIATVMYRVTNQAGIQRTLAMDHINGVSQVTTPGYCPTSFTLNDNESCILNLTITGSALSGNVSGGPMVCQQGSHLQCYEPENNTLKIKKVSTAFTVGGTVSGLIGTVTLQNNGGSPLSINADGSFSFPETLSSGNTYAVSVQTQPATQTCSVSNGTGTITNQNITNVVINCSVNTHTLSVNVSGLSGTVVLQNNGTDDLTITTNGLSTFSTPIAQNSPYLVSVFTQPISQTCTLGNASGTMGNANVTNVTLTCSANAYKVGGTVSGLSGTVTLQNGPDVLPVNANGIYQFPTSVAQGATYNVSVNTQPATQTCNVANPSGTMGGANVTNANVSCTLNTTTLTPSVNSIALSVNAPGTNAALTGNARTITITNSGAYTATGVNISYPVWPTGTSALSNCGATLAASSSCTITITPGANATSTCTTGIAATPGNITITTDNASTIIPTAVVLGYGCVYQGGYIFSVDDTTSTVGSIGGKVLSTVDQAPRFPAGIIWSSNNAGTYDGGISIYGISETSTSATPNPAGGQVAGQNACNGKNDGACDSSNVVVYYQGFATGAPVSNSFYAAGLCKATIATFSDWYLPAICEMNHDDLIHTPVAGCAPGTQNIVDSLPFLLGDPSSNPDTSCTRGSGCLAGYYNSSTELASDPTNQVWHDYFTSGGGSYHLPDAKSYLLGVRCVRVF